MVDNIQIDQHLSHIDEFETTYDAFKYLKRLTSEIGYQKFSILRSSPGCTNLTSMTILGNWDAELVQEYDGKNLVNGSPILEHTQTSGRPLLFQIQHLPQNRSVEMKRLSVELFKEFEMTAGISLPVQTFDSVKGTIIFCGSKGNIEKPNAYNLHILANYIYDKIVSVDSNIPNDAPQLTERERDCLSWTAAGKTSAEIAAILELSDHTINHYLSAAARKLDAVNRVHAVTKAIQLRLISIA